MSYPVFVHRGHASLAASLALQIVLSAAALILTTMAGG
jgi:hypothetical protein